MTNDTISFGFYKDGQELPLCPRCNHRHRFKAKPISYRMDECPYCNCPLHYDLLEEEYTL